ncbi:MAG: tetratricopeptide repeat protein [Candidatus Eisenbacteria bacterium]|uniref:Tetratricopeptide repeat protein n=1 Tax=Eiseniibacteriota bacterium TaxID=2212470 RepID=A0A956ND94_UNCEI|nr:tetratricopeptide repeat protein [Candidatus Eisenbacteria bacterium]MCB9462782.1 tetratricopeptide repeat protein [Candidatus Eisenbacteria bacterium]
MAVAKRMTKEELREDKVVTALKELGEIAKENSRTLVIIAIVVAVAIGAWMFVKQSRARAEENASLSLAQAQKLYFDGRYTEAATQLESILGDYGSTNAAKSIPLFLGNCKLAAGDAAGAKAAFETLSGKAGADPLLAAAADRGIGAALSDQGDMTGAAESYRRAAQRADNPLAAEDWMAAGNAFLEAGKKDEATAAFQKVVSDYPTSQRAVEAKVRLAEVESR